MNRDNVLLAFWRGLTFPQIYFFNGYLENKEDASFDAVGIAAAAEKKSYYLNFSVMILSVFLQNYLLRSLQIEN